MSHPWPRLAALIAAALDEGESYRSLAAKTRNAISASGINNIALGKRAGKNVSPGVWPAPVPQLKALAKALGQPWDVVRDACLDDTGTAHVGTHDGAHIVLSRARETLTPAELETWAAMTEELIELVRKNRGK